MKAMKLDLPRFFKACNPSITLNFGNDEERKYYIDFSSVRGSNIIREVERTITLLAGEAPSCQLFTGHIGCGKSTELLRLKAELEVQGFHVVYFESSQDLDMGDVDITDILLAIARQVSESLEKLKIKLQPQGFKAILQGAAELLQTELDISAGLGVPGIAEIKGNNQGQISLSAGIGYITLKTKDSPKLRGKLRQYLEPRANSILEAINDDLLVPATEQLKRLGKKGLVVIVDNLDRIDSSLKPSGQTQPEYLFVERGEQLNKLKCHVVYTIPLVLIFSNDLGRLTNRFGVNPKVLPMVPVKLRDGSHCAEGMALLRQMVLARAFPEVPEKQRLSLINELFDSPQTLDRLCCVSGGHMRNLLVLLYGCLQKQDPPISKECLETTIKQRCNELNLAITPDEWEVLLKVAKQKDVRGEIGYQTMLRSLFVFEYRDRDGSWFDINPILKEAKNFQKLLELN